MFWGYILFYNFQIFVDRLNETSLINIVASLVPPVYVSENDTIAYIRQEICNETRLDEIFYFPNQTMSQRVHDELCGLSPDQFFTLVDDFVEDFDPVAFEEEVIFFLSFKIWYFQFLVNNYEKRTHNHSLSNLGSWHIYFSSVLKHVITSYISLESAFWNQLVLVSYVESLSWLQVGLKPMTPGLRDRHLNLSVTASLIK